MPSLEEIDAAAKAIQDKADEIGDPPFPFYPRELRAFAEAALKAAERVRALWRSGAESGRAP